MTSAISIGKQDFASLRENHYFYVDKTDFIRQWWESGDDITLITRPRRFGKTLNMSMLNCFFSRQYAEKGTIFEGLSIWKQEKYRRLQGTYPVIFLSFADVKQNNYQDAVQKIKNIIVDAYRQHRYLEQEECFTQNEKQQMLEITEKMSDVTAQDALKNLSSYLNLLYGKKVLIFLDEYDTPMQEAYIHGYWGEFAGFMRSLFNATFKTNPYLDRAVMTGITRISKESVFSDLNNLTVITTTSDAYADCFGFTEKEVFQSLDQFGMPEKKELVKQWYDGFCFGTHRDIYNPWSITKYLDTGEYGTYWADTSGNMLISNLIRRSPAKIKTEMEDLLNGRVICTELDEQVIFEQLGRKRGAIWSLMLASGYLKVDRYEMDNRTGKRQYDLKVTNHETMLMFEQMIEDWFTEEDSAYGNFKDALLAGDLDYMNQFMNQVALQTFSSFDTGGKPSEELEPERFYHGFVLGLIVDLAGKYRITSNRESGFGRYDVVMEPLKENLDAIVMEFKVQNTSKEKSLEETVEHALRQIQEKQYDTELLARGIAKERIRYYGFAFRGKKVLIGN